MLMLSYQMNTKIVMASLAIAGSLGLAASTQARGLGDVQISVDVNGTVTNLLALPTFPLGDGFVYFGGHNDAGWELDWSFQGESNSSNGHLQVTNNMAFSNVGATSDTLDVIITVSMEVQSLGSTIVSGSFGTGFTNTQIPTVFLRSLNGANMYTGMVDGVALAPSALIAAPFEASAGSFGSANIDPVNMVAFANGSVISTIGYQIRFQIEGNADVTMSGAMILDAAPIPAPGVLALLGIAGLAGPRRRRR